MRKALTEYAFRLFSNKTKTFFIWRWNNSFWVVPCINAIFKSKFCDMSSWAELPLAYKRINIYWFKLVLAQGEVFPTISICFQSSIFQSFACLRRFNKMLLRVQFFLPASVLIILKLFHGYGEMYFVWHVHFFVGIFQLSGNSWYHRLNKIYHSLWQAEIKEFPINLIYNGNIFFSYYYFKYKWLFLIFLENQIWTLIDTLVWVKRKKQMVFF